MLKNDYKIIFIKEGKFGLKQIDLSFFQLISICIILFSFISFLSIFFANQLLNWSSKADIQNHRIENQIIIENYQSDKNRIDSLFKQLELIKEQDELLRKLVKLPPIEQDVRKMGYGGIKNDDNFNDMNYLLPENDIDFEIYRESLDRVHRLIKLELLSYEEINKEIKENKNEILGYPAIYPVMDGRENLSSNYGYRLDPFSKKYRFHGGHDFSSRTGTDVYSTADGKVIKSKYWGSFGNYIEIDHGYGFITVYGHLYRRDVKLGDKVSRGQKIGEVGNTGRSTAPHLHYEVKYNKKTVDPTDYYFDISIN